MGRCAEIKRETKETRIYLNLDLDGSGKADISTGIPFFDHMLTAFTVHGFFDLTIDAQGDLDVDFHHTVEDTGLVLGQALDEALGDKKGIVRFGQAAVPMDESLSQVNIDLSNRPYLVYNFPDTLKSSGPFNVYLAKEFFQAFSVKGACNLHINVLYGDNEHHALESVFKAMGRCLHMASRVNEKITDTLSSKGCL